MVALIEYPARTFPTARKPFWGAAWASRHRIAAADVVCSHLRSDAASAHSTPQVSCICLPPYVVVLLMGSRWVRARGWCDNPMDSAHGADISQADHPPCGEPAGSPSILRSLDVSVSSHVVITWPAARQPDCARIGNISVNLRRSAPTCRNAPTLPLGDVRGPHPLAARRSIGLNICLGSS